MTITAVEAARGGRTLRAAAAVTGVALVVEAGVSIVVDSHVEYHALNAVLNVALAVAALLLAMSGRGAVGTTGVVGGWATCVLALLAGLGGAWVVAVEGFGGAEAPGAAEGVTHTAVLASILFLVLLGLGVRKLDRPSGLLIAASSACLVAMVLVGLDQPEVFAVPEAVLGIGWVRLSAALQDEHR